MAAQSEPAPQVRPRALIVGVGGQDGCYMARWLVDRGYEVVGTSRDPASIQHQGLHQLGLAEQILIVPLQPTDYGAVSTTIDRFAPDEIYNLSGQSSVGRSFTHPVATFESIAVSAQHLLEAVRTCGRRPRFFNAGSGECFGDASGAAATEATPLRPRSPYATAKAFAAQLTTNYREAYGLHACTGILFNHESPLRPDTFVTQKIVRAAARIALGSRETLQLGNLDIQRDWGWAPDYVEAMWRMLQAEQPEDLIIATGESVSLQDFVVRAFSTFDLDWRDHVHFDRSLLRPHDIQRSAADPSRAQAAIGWRAATRVNQVIERLCRSAIDAQPLLNVPGSVSGVPT